MMNILSTAEMRQFTIKTSGQPTLLQRLQNVDDAIIGWLSQFTEIEEVPQVKVPTCAQIHACEELEPIMSLGDD